MQKSDNISEITKALVEVQSKLQPAAMDTENPFFRTRYADLASVWKTCRELLAANGLAVVQTTRAADDGVVVETMLIHTSGEWFMGELLLPLVKRDPQGVGSAITYGRRYGLSAMLGIVADDDDDGNSHTKAPAAQQSAKTTKTAKPAAPGKDSIITQLKAVCSAKEIDFKEFILKSFPKVSGSADLTEAQLKLLLADAQKQ